MTDRENITITKMKRLSGCAGALALLISCGAPSPQSKIPPLDPQQAGSLLHFNNKAQDWLKYVHRTNPACDYQLNLPDQSAHPTSIDLTHIVVCSGAAAPKEFDASVSFAYDTAQKHWVITRFSS